MKFLLYLWFLEACFVFIVAALFVIVYLAICAAWFLYSFLDCLRNGQGFWEAARNGVLMAWVWPVFLGGRGPD